MTLDEAKSILRASRPEGQDDVEPHFVEAVALARREPELARWLERERALDKLISVKLGDVRAPVRLKAAILEGDAVVHEVAKPWANWPRWSIAAAAAVVLFLALAWQLSRPSLVAADTLASTAIETLSQEFSLARTSTDVEQLKAWLAGRNAPVPRQLPASFAALRGLGCKELTVSGNKVSLICFQDGGKEVHLFVMNVDALAPGARRRDPRFSQRGAWALAQWTDERFAYLLVSNEPVGDLRRLL